MAGKDGGYRSQRQREREQELGGSPSGSEWSGPGRSRRGRHHWSPGSQVWIGVAIVIFGLALLLDNLGVIESSRQILRFWPVVLVAIGVGDLFSARGRARAVRGALLTSFGVLFLLDNLNFIDFRVWDIWPVVLILLGVQILMHARHGSGHDIDELVDKAEFDDVAFLGGVKRRNTSSAFRGGSASAIMGGVELDLRKANMEGDRAVINVFAMMGGVALRIPEDWAVSSQVVAILGAVDDKTHPPADPLKTLVLTGTVLMGGVEIKD